MVARAAAKTSIQQLLVGCFGVGWTGTGWRLFDGIQCLFHVFLEGIDDADSDCEVSLDLEVHLEASVILLAAGQEPFVC